MRRLQNGLRKKAVLLDPISKYEKNKAVKRASKINANGVKENKCVSGRNKKAGLFEKFTSILISSFSGLGKVDNSNYMFR